MSRALSRMGDFAARRPWTVIAVWLVVAVGIVGSASAYGSRLEDSFRVPGLDSQQAADLLAEAGSDQAGMTAQVVVTPSDGTATFLTSEPARAALADLQRDAAALSHVLSTNDPSAELATGGTTRSAPSSVSPDGRIVLLRLQYPGIEELSSGDLDELKDLLAQVDETSPVRVEAGGDLYFAFEAPPTGVGEALGLLLAAIVLFVAFGSLVATALPLVTAILGLAIGVSSMSLLAGVVDVPSYAPVLGSMVGLGVCIDYALFILTRHRAGLAAGMPVRASVGAAITTAGRPVVTAGLIVVVSILGLAVAGVPFMTIGGLAIAIVVLVMVAACVTLLPALLAVVGPRVVSRRRRSSALPSATDARWARWAGHVTRHPWPYLVLGVTALLALAAPALALRTGIPDDGALPPSWTQRQAYDLVSDGFGPGANGPLIVAVDLRGDRAALDPLLVAVGEDPGIVSVSSPVVDADAGVAAVVAIPTTGPQDAVTNDTVVRLRTEVIPQALAGSPARAHVGGQTANFADVGERVHARLPVFIGAVLALSFLLLLLTFRSVLVPLKAVLLNLLSIGAAYGVLVMVFQWGWGGALIGLEATVPIVSFIPMFMFAILFGLSMDYEVFLLSRIHEEYVAGASSRTSIVRGVSSTARVITSAAAIMIAVFLAFVLGADAGTKMFGLGLATAVLIDATVVRMILVPATMTLLGDANWWWRGRGGSGVAPSTDIDVPLADRQVDGERVAGRSQRALPDRVVGA